MQDGFRATVNELLWRLIEQHYNVDRNCPQLLTARNLLFTKVNPVDQISEDMADFIERLFIQAATLKTEEEEKKDPNSCKSNCSKKDCEASKCSLYSDEDKGIFKVDLYSKDE
jgi:hypothetical protein